MTRSAPGSSLPRPTGTFVGWLLLLLVFAGQAAAASWTVGVVAGDGRRLRSPEQALSWGEELARALNRPVTVRLFDSEEQLLDWLLRYRQLELGLIGADRLAGVPAGQLTPVPLPGTQPQGAERTERLVAGPAVDAGQLAVLMAAPPAAVPGPAALPVDAPEPAAIDMPVAAEVPERPGDGEPEALVVGLRLNGEERGAFVVYRAGADYFARTDDLRTLGIVALPQARRIIHDEEYADLGAIAGARVDFDAATGELAVDVPATVFAGTRIDFLSPRVQTVLRPRDDSQFLNYGVEYRATGGSLEEDAWRWTGEAGARFGDYLLLGDGFYDDDGDQTRFVRLQTRVIRDDRETLRRYTAGDLVARGGRFSSRVALGGVGVEKIFGIDPYYIENPMYRFAGVATLPTTLEILVDGQRIRTEQLPPGPFAIEHLWQTLGSRDIELVLRDALGRETRISSPYYFSNRLLRQGVHEYSYNLGLMRRNFGVENDDYAQLAWSAFHRFGATDGMTLTAETEGGDGLAALGGGVLWRLGPWGTLDLGATGSRDGDRQGAAGFVGYEFQSRAWRWQAEASTFSPEFATLDNRDWGRRLRASYSTSIGYIDPLFGSLTFAYAVVDGRREMDREQFTTTSWFRNLGRQLSLNVSYTRGEGRKHEVAARLNYYFDRSRGLSFSTEARHSASADSQSVELGRAVPTGEGVGWRAAASRSRDAGGETVGFSPFIQYNAPFGIYRSDFESLDRDDGRSDEQSLRLSAAGGVAHIDGKIGFSRPIRDSFGLVRIGDLEGVRVYVNNQQVGRTGKDGRLFVPELNSYFDNQVSIESKDVPIDYLMAVTRRDLSPPLRSGSCVDFPAQRYQSFWGQLVATAADEPLGLAYEECRLETPGGTVTFSIDGDGNFFFDTTDLGKSLALRALGCADGGAQAAASLAGPGTLRCRSDRGAVVCPFEIPAGTEPAVDLGVRECRAVLAAGE